MGDSFSTVGDTSALWRLFSTVADSFSTVADNISTVEGIQYSGGKNFNFNRETKGYARHNEKASVLNERKNLATRGFENEKFVV